jgi:phosphatidylserine/phosphatidylglycerophosphate/cardiolipin synthase-like enzyme
MPRDPAPRGSLAIQVLRTYPHKRHHPYPFAPKGERSIARAYAKAVKRARRLIYVEDQYFWSRDVAQTLADALRDTPTLRLIAVLPRFPEQPGLAAHPESLGQQEAVELVRRAGGDRVGIYDLENEQGTPIYVHAKVCVMDDVWAMVGSDNLNRRSWTHDSELSCAVLDDERDERTPADPAGLGDGARRFARDIRLRLWHEHLGESFDEAELLDPVKGFEAWREAARERPPGARVVEHRTPPVPAIHRPWARFVYRRSVDPDGRPRRLRKKGAF